MSDVLTLAEGLGLNAAQLAQLEENLAALKVNTLLALDSDVARAKEGARITSAGLDIIAQGNAGAQIKYKSVWIGDAVKNGEIVTPSNEEILSMTNLVHPILKANMAGAVHTGGGTFTIKFIVDNSTYEQGFWLREIGLFATDPATGVDKLYCYKNDGKLATYIPPNDGAVAKKLVISLVTVVDQASNITAIIDAKYLYVNAEEFNAHEVSTNPHPEFLQKRGELTASSFYWAAGDDNHLHPISKSNLQLDILGDSVYELPNLSSRIGQTEMNLANLYAQLKAESEIGLAANLLLFEDFTDYSCIDTFTADVPIQVRDVQNLYVSSFAGIQEGSWYTVSDGLHSQTLQVKALASNGDNKAVIFTENLLTNFDLSKTKLYRTTCSMSAGQITSSGGEKTRRYDFSTDEWTGEAAGVPQTLTTAITETSQNYSKGAGKNGKYADFTLDGEFTLTMSSLMSA